MAGMIDSTTVDISKIWNYLEIPNSIDPNIVWEDVNLIVDPLTFKPLIKCGITSKMLDDPDYMAPISLKNFDLIQISEASVCHVTDFKLAFEFNINTIDGGLLNLLKIPNLTRIRFRFRKIHKIKGEDQPSSFPPLVNAFNIINDHLKDRNILACQRDLLKAGLTEYAKF